MTAILAGYDPMVVLEQVFVPGFDNDIPMPSNRTLRGTSSLHEVYIRDIANSTYHFNAAVSTASNAAIFFSVNSTDRSGENMPHPDLYAARLLGRAVRFFDAGPYGPLERVEGTWLMEDGSDNFVEYIDNLRKFGPGPYTQEQKRWAAENTWTGRRVNDLGFTVASAVRTKRKHISVYFDRPT